MSKPAPIHICFYSTRCKWSKVFIEEVSKTDYHKDFRFVCVDPGPNRPQLPSWLKQTPTLMIRGEQEPRVDSEVMNWLYEQRMRDGGKTNSPNGAPHEPEPYLDMEMGGGYGDSYSFINDDTSTQGNGGNNVRHNFTYLDGNNSVGTREASSFPVNSSNPRRSKKEEMLDQQMEQYKMARELGMPKMISRQ